LLRIEVNLHGFSVVAHILIGWVDGGAASVANARSVNSFDGSKLGLGTPESAKCKRSSLQRLGNGKVYRR